LPDFFLELIVLRRQRTTGWNSCELFHHRGV
jgi:hypothetical protein